MFRALGAELSGGERARRDASCKGKCVNAFDSDCAQPASPLPLPLKR